MSIDLFGRKLGSSENSRGPPGAGFIFTSDGHFNIESRRLTNIQEAVDPNDAVNLKTVKSLIQAEIDSINFLLRKVVNTVEHNKHKLALLETKIENYKSS